MDSWLEWEACSLRPAALLACAPRAPDAAPLAAALSHLAASLTKQASGWLVGTQPTAADLAVAATLQPLKLHRGAPGLSADAEKPVLAFLAKVAELPAWKWALEQVCVRPLCVCVVCVCFCAE